MGNIEKEDEEKLKKEDGGMWIKSWANVESETGER